MSSQLNETSAFALYELILKTADDELILGHRNSEWIGIGPVIEEDIAFGSLAQDVTGHAYNLYQLLEKEFAAPEPDKLAFFRKENEYKCCHFVELPIGQYDFSLMRHFLFDHAELIRYEMLAESSYEPLAQLAKKFKSEIKYHVFHANTWITQLGSKGNEESKHRMQTALNEALPYAFGLFEPLEYDAHLASENIFAGEAELEKRWLERIIPIIENASLQMPDIKDKTIFYGGRKGYHTEYLQPLLTEMTEVLDSEDATADW